MLWCFLSVAVVLRYDPVHYGVPEGSYSTAPDGPLRILEYREMVQVRNMMLACVMHNCLHFDQLFLEVSALCRTSNHGCEPAASVRDQPWQLCRNPSTLGISRQFEVLHAVANQPLRCCFDAVLQSLHSLGLRVVLDVVYNHTFASGPYSHNSVLDKIVPGYYHRRQEDGEMCHSTCCKYASSVLLAPCNSSFRILFEPCQTLMQLWS